MAVRAFLSYHNSYKNCIYNIFSSQDSSGNTPLHNAIIQQDEKIIAEILAYYPQACDIKNLNQQTPIDFAITRIGLLQLFLQAAYDK